MVLVNHHFIYLSSPLSLNSLHFTFHNHWPEKPHRCRYIFDKKTPLTASIHPHSLLTSKNTTNNYLTPPRILFFSSFFPFDGPYHRHHLYYILCQSISTDESPKINEILDPPPSSTSFLPHLLYYFSLVHLKPSIKAPPKPSHATAAPATMDENSQQSPSTPSNYTTKQIPLSHLSIFKTQKFKYPYALMNYGEL